MSYEFKLPDIGEGIHEAELLAWRVRPGDRVKDGDELATFSTDKVTVELPSPCAGTIVSVHGTPGQVLTVGTVIAVIERALSAGASQANIGTVAHANGHATPVHADLVRRSSPQSVAGANASAAPPQAGGPIVAAPSTRRLARELGVSLSGVSGSGPGGRVLRADVQAAAAGSQGAEHGTARTAHTELRHASARMSVPSAGLRRLRLSGARATSAKNLFDSVHKSATTTSTFEVVGDGIKLLLRKLAPEAERRGLKLSPLHVIAKCTAAALIRHERFNATIDDDTSELVLHERVDLGVAVAADGRLTVPVIRGVDQRLLLDVAQDVTEVSERARHNGLKVSDLRGGTFTLSSTGGLERATMISTRPIIHRPQAAILWVSRITDRPRVTDGQLNAGPMMVCSLSFDHRYIDGAEATHFINDLSAYLEHPEQAIV